VLPGILDVVGISSTKRVSVVTLTLWS